MGISTQTITVDLSKRLTRPQVVRLGQGDKLGTTLVANIYENGVAYNLNGKTARFAMRAPDGSSSYSVVASSYNGNKATFDLDETYAASIAGKTDTAYIEILSGSTVICSTSRITVVVYRSASQGLPVSGAYSDALEEAISTFAEMQRAFADMQRAFASMQELVMPPATTTTLGGVIVGDGLDVASDGTLSFEAGDHSHSASDITDGTLAVAHGGTGVTTAAAERERLGLGSTTGALPIANGGTGAADAATALTNLGAASAADLETVEGMVELLPVANGGTGATTAAAALTALGAAAASDMAVYEESSPWASIKFPALGVRIAWANTVITGATVTIVSQAYGGYRSDSYNVAIPSGWFTSAPAGSVFKNGSKAWRVNGATMTTTQIANIYLASGTEESADNFPLSIILVGKC